MKNDTKIKLDSRTWFAGLKQTQILTFFFRWGHGGRAIHGGRMHIFLEINGGRPPKNRRLRRAYYSWIFLCENLSFLLLEIALGFLLQIYMVSVCIFFYKSTMSNFQQKTRNCYTEKWKSNFGDIFWAPTMDLLIPQRQIVLDHVWQDKITSNFPAPAAGCNSFVISLQFSMVGTRWAG